MSLLEKREYAAYTIRPKIHRLLPQYLQGEPKIKVRKPWSAPVPEWHVPVTLENVSSLVAGSEIDHGVRPSTAFRGGSVAARRRFKHFIRHGLRRYAREKNEPTAHATSNLSPYLHFGHISSREIALEVRDYASANDLIADEFLEELIVRRELAFNFARFTPEPSLGSLPDWAQRTLDKHRADRHDPEYSREAFEVAATHDPLWNATQKELLLRGTIHGYYRMYWGKKIIEWSRTPEDAFEIMVYLHDRYALDGRDPNTYTNILWCFGLHDRPWTERPVFGQVRYMSFEGMKRKTDVVGYIREIDHLERTGDDLLAL
jgi:deoxyribodipyrimidine photo-lyase